MTPRYTRWTAAIVAVLSLSLLFAAVQAAEKAPGGWGAGQPKKILYFTKCSGFVHSVVQRPQDGSLSHSEKILTELGAKHGFEVTCSKDGRDITKENLAKYDVFCFYTSGMLTEEGTDKNPPMSLEGKAALLAAVKNGKGFVCIHAGNDSFHLPSTNPGDGFVAHGDKADPYIKMTGGEFIKHGPQQVAKNTVVDGKFPGCEGLGESFEAMEEWYTFKDFTPDLHVILVQETKGMNGLDYQRAPYPATWARKEGKGRVFYTSLGHREDIWTNPRFQSVLLGGLGWAAGKVDADVKPNLGKATPGYREIQPQDEKKK